MAEETSPATNWISEAPQSNRQRVLMDAFGIGAFGVGRHSSKDRTEQAWTRDLADVTTAILLALFLAAPAAADTVTPNLQLIKPTVGVVDPVTPWGDKHNGNQDILEASICDKRVGCTISGPVTVTTLTATAIIGESSVSVSVPLTGDGLSGTPIGVDPSSVTLLGPSIGASEVDSDIATTAALQLVADDVATSTDTLAADIQTLADDVAVSTNTLDTNKANLSGATFVGDVIVNNKRDQGLKTLAQIQTLVCPEGANACVVWPSDEVGTVYRSSGALAGQYINNRGVGP